MHTKNGLYFDRQTDGSVKVTLKRPYADALLVSKSQGPEMAFETVLDPLTWASAVAAVSKRGQIMEVIEAALEVHEKAERHIEVPART